MTKLRNSTLPREHAFYVQLIPILSTLFQRIGPEKVEQLNKAAYAYFGFLLSLDQFIDAPTPGAQEESLSNLLEKLVDFEEGIGLLAELFPQPSPFWENFNHLKKRYFQSILREKQLAKTKPELSEADFHELAIGKSILCQNSVFESLNQVCTY